MGGFAVSFITMYIIFIFIWIGYRVIVRKKYKMSVMREIAVNIFFIYFLGVLYFTVFKQGMISISFDKYSYINLVPLKETMKMFAENFMGVGNAIYNVVGNILLFVPLGFFIPVLFKQADNLKKVLLYGFASSVSIEAIQYFTAINITDIDDVIFNTMGAGLGFICYRIFKKVLGRNNSKKLLDSVQDREQRKILVLAVKPLGAMVLALVAIIYAAAYMSTFSGELSNEEMAISAFSKYSDGEFVVFKDFDRYKFSLKDEGDYIQLGRLQKAFNNRYTADRNIQLHWSNKNVGYGADIIEDYDNNQVAVVVFGKNNSSNSISITLNGEQYTEKLEPNKYFIVIYPEYKKLKDDTDIYDIYSGKNSRDLRIEFFNAEGEIDNDMDFIK